MDKYYIFCSDITGEGWYEEFDTLEEARAYLKENYGNCEILIKGQEIDYTRNVAR